MAGSTSAIASAVVITAAGESPPGAVNPIRWAPSLLIAEPLMTAWTWSPSAIASARRFQHHQPNTVATHRAGGVEGAAVPVRGQDPVLRAKVAAVFLLVHRDTARQRHVALVDSRDRAAITTDTSDVEQVD